MEAIDKLNKLIASSKNISILTHTNPDGDAIGSSLGFYHFLNNMKANVRVIIPNEAPEFLRWMPQCDEILEFTSHKEVICKEIQESDLLIFLDLNELKRVSHIEKYVAKSKAIKVMIDHHPNPSDFCDIVISDTTVSSTAELIYMVIDELGGKAFIDTKVAQCIFTGILTDTGGFTYNSSNPRTFKIVADLLEYGINKDKICTNIFDNYSAGRMKLLGHVLRDKMDVITQYHTAIIALTKQDQKEFGFNTADSEGFVNFPLSVKDVIFSVFITERDDKVKLSFRSKGDFSCTDFSHEHFNGGGHFNASGAETKMSVAETVQFIIDLLPQYQNQLNKAFDEKYTL